MLHIGILQFSVEIPYALSLKDKRSAIKSLKDRLRRSFNVSIAEIDDLDVCTVATLGAVVAGSEIAHLNSSMDHLLNALQEWRDGTLVDHQLEIISPMNERRIARLQEQIKHCLAQTLLRDLADPKLGMVTITRVELDGEFTQCKAYWSVIGDGKQQKESAGVLRRARGLCQRAIGKAIRARTMPHLEFYFDEGIGGAIGLNQLLADLGKEREQREAERAAQGPDAPGADEVTDDDGGEPRQDS